MNKLMEAANMAEEATELRAIADEAVMMWEDGLLRLDDLLFLNDYIYERIMFIEIFI